jgi:signal transduction histidine kinase
VLHSLRFRLLLTMSVVVLVAVGAVALFSSRSTTNEFERYVQDGIARNQRIISELLKEFKGDTSPESLQALVEHLSASSGERLVVADRQGKVVADSTKQMVGQQLEFPMPARAFRSAPGTVIGLEGGLSATIPLTEGFTGTIGTLLPFTPTTLMFNGDVAAASLPMTPVFEMSFPGTVSNTQGSAVQAGLPFTEVGTVGNYLAWEPVFVPLAAVPVGGDVMVSGVPASDFIVARIPQPAEQGFLNSVNQQLLLSVAVAGAVALLLAWFLSRRILGPVEALTRAAGKMEKGDLAQRVDVRSRDEIGELGHAFNAMADGLTHLEQLRRNMVSDVAHELRTPLSNIRGYLEAVRDGVAHPDPALIDSLHEEAMLLTRLVEDLQELELAEAGQLKIVKQAVEPRDVLERVVHLFQPSAREKGIQLNVTLPATLPTVEVDAERLGQVLRNLLANAITHTPLGGRIEIAAIQQGKSVVVSVRDTGAGIPEEDLPFIFERFYRADHSRARSTGGAGLGLSIVKQLVELHGGRVWADSQEGEGSTFYLSLPALDRHLG